MRKFNGFTFIELLITIAIVAIIAGIAYPSYQSHLLKTRRGEAITDLLKAQLKQSSWHILNPTYSSDKNELGLIDNDNYTYSVTEVTSTTYLLQADAKSGPQTSDTGCTRLTIDQSSNQTPASCW